MQKKYILTLIIMVLLVIGTFSIFIIGAICLSPDKKFSSCPETQASLIMLVLGIVLSFISFCVLGAGLGVICCSENRKNNENS